MKKYRIVQHPIGYYVEVEQKSWFGYGKSRWVRYSSINPFSTSEAAEDWLRKRAERSERYEPKVIKEVEL